ncbi:MAG: TolC family protein [Candidatus Omnitrophica bacterium]|nr:TolC family protein [Candidatus Omnitrophota bacterium]
MKKQCVLIMGVICFLCVQAPALWAAEKVSAYTLNDCYQMALKQSETVAIQKEFIKEAEGQMLQSLSTALPKVFYSYSQQWQDVPKTTWNSQYSPSSVFTLSQPLFTGFKEFAAISASKHLGRERAAELKRARELLFTDVSDAFYLYLSYQQDEETLSDIQHALYNQLGELQKRQLVGRSRLSEVANAEARLRGNQALIEGVRAQKEVARQLLEFLIGGKVSYLEEGLDVEFSDIPQDALMRFSDQRADVVAASESLELFKNNIVSARSGFFPTVSLTADAYTKRSDINEGNDWDAMIVVSVPIMNGTTDVGNLRVAKAQKREAELRLSQARRTASLDIQNAYTRWKLLDSRRRAFEKAVEASQKNYRLQKDDFEKNLISNIDLLQSLEDLQNTRRDLVAAKADARRAFSAFKVATGELLP